MAFDQATRNRLQRFVADARDLLMKEVTRQLQHEYGLDPSSGSVTPLDELSIDDSRLETARILRDTLQHYLSSSPSSNKKEILERIVREQAFTVLNRMAALRMSEARGILIESLARGYTSKGFQLYTKLAGSGLGETGDSYRGYLFSIFDEFAPDLKVLFDRFSPYGRLFPRNSTLLELLELLNSEDIDSLWGEDETIGWIYQYFNTPQERKRMREESAAPRNSRELAVRNQFFTPRYVVEFLTDNTLGRIWYEMTRGETKLKEQCRFLVRRPNEIFLKPGETASEQPKQDNLSQEDLLKQPVHIPNRPLKDPRTILMLDPACGSMHFGLYAFDLFEIVYVEAWELEDKLGTDALRRPSGMKSLRDTYAGKDAFLKDVPCLIIEHNLHGIDIDPRCTQIAGLSLWLRAQKAWQRLGLKPAERPAIKRSNIVCAEPMPGEKELLREFVEQEFRDDERGIFLPLLEAIFDKMKLAGEAGSLLKIEEEIRSAISDASKLWKKGPHLEQAKLFRELEPAKQKELDLTGITDEKFWVRVEERMYVALRDYAEQAENGGGFQRRLFAEDAARGFAFIDVCRKRYDVVLMNPPFGEPAVKSKPYIFSHFAISKYDLASAFAHRAADCLCHQGVVGSLTNRSIFYGQALERWRAHQFLDQGTLQLFSDLGVGVLDSALVEAVAYTFSNVSGGAASLFFKALNRGNELHEFLHPLATGALPLDCYLLPIVAFRRIPDFPFAYWVPADWLNAYTRFGPLSSQGLVVKQGMESSDNFRFVRLWWETSLTESKWRPYSKGGSFGPHWRDIDVSVNWGVDGKEVKAFSGSIHGSWAKQITNTEYYGVAGLCYPASRVEFSPRILPRGCVIGCKGPIVAFENASTDNTTATLILLAVMSSSAFRALVNLTTTSGDTMSKSYRERAVVSVPTPDLRNIELQVADQTAAIVNRIRLFEASLETCRGFLKLALPAARRVLADEVRQSRKVLDADICRHFGFRGPAYLHFEKTGYDDLADHSDMNADELPSFIVGCTFGRWDIRYATGERAAARLPDPFAPLPVCPPGQLQDAQGLPVRPEDIPAAYPVQLPWDGILVDDPNHPLDIERRVRDVIEIIWGGAATTQNAGGVTAEAIEREACEILGVKSLRDYFRKPAGFFADHLKRYSKSRRQAPIYWPLSTGSGSYTLWIYYHRLTDQTLFQCVNDFVKPKLEEVNHDIERVRGELQRGDGGSSQQREKLEELEDFAIELKEFHDELLRVAGLPYKPNLNDGVLITASPLWKLFRLPKWHKDLKACWQKVETGEYDWAHLAYTIWPDRVSEVCRKDRSIAIAHDLEELCEVKTPVKKSKQKKKKLEQIRLEAAGS